jgi:hypothetical protein
VIRKSWKKLSGLAFYDYMAILYRWKDLEDSPIPYWWHLETDLTARSLEQCTAHITKKNDLKILSESFVAVFNDMEIW